MPDKSTYFWRSPTVQLTLTYLAIIMTMSISFSAIVYGVSARQLDRQLSESAYIDSEGTFGPTPRVERYLKDRIQTSKRNLFLNIVVLNGVMIVFGGAISFLLARRTLTPIEQSVDAQARFVSDASHELRTPLTSLRLINEIALRDHRLTIKQARETIASNLEEVIRLQNLANLLLGLLSAEQFVAQKEPVLLREIVAKAITIVQPQADDKLITIKCHVSTQTIVAVNHELIVQAVVAVLDNAIKYSPQNSFITIDETQTKRYAAVTISDQGSGIKEVDPDKVFQRFYRSSEARTRSEQNGFGLGLSIAKQIIDAHDGQISVKSQEGKGGVFSIRLPKLVK